MNTPKIPIHFLGNLHWYRQLVGGYWEQWIETTPKVKYALYWVRFPENQKMVRPSGIRVFSSEDYINED